MDTPGNTASWAAEPPSAEVPPAEAEAAPAVEPAADAPPADVSSAGMVRRQAPALAGKAERAAPLGTRATCNGALPVPPAPGIASRWG